MNKAKADAGVSKQVNERPKDDLLKRIDGSRRKAVSILQDTKWPQQANTPAQELLQVISKSPKLDNLPKDTNKIPTEQISVMERLASIMGDVCTKLKKASQKYGEKRDFSDMLKHPLASLNKDGCKKLLQECVSDVQKALASLADDLSNDAHSRRFYFLAIVIRSSGTCRSLSWNSEVKTGANDRGPWNDNLASGQKPQRSADNPHFTIGRETSKSTRKEK
ncbi:hypothetical protein FS837_012429 [Tulasnella sp. UAMH 9824]|nr:hypothetical protein FS837_012429 [Tulasnella sp. UAMH 9824]